jgi:hypothetical protein
MGTIWTFGDSFTASFNEKSQWGTKYINWKGYVPKVYGDFLAEQYSMNLNNMGKGGADNYTIFENFCNNCHRIKSDDIVIFGWSSPMRFRLVTNMDYWHTFIPNVRFIESGFDSLSKSTIDETIYNRSSYKFCEEVNSWIKLINFHLNDIKVAHWTYFDVKLNAKFINTLENIKQETNGEVNDGHFSENGHLELSKILHTMINTNKSEPSKLI